MNKPIKRFNCGTITASVWSNNKIVNQDMVDIHSIKINKAYKDGDEWKHTHSLSVEDLLKVAIVATEVYKYLRLRISEKEDSSNT